MGTGDIFNFQNALAEADPLNEDFTLIPLYKDNFPIVHEAELGRIVGLTGDYHGLYDYLEQEGYIDENGMLTEQFYRLTDSIELSNLPLDFEIYRDDIYSYLKDLNRAWFDDNINDKFKGMEEWLNKSESVALEILRQIDYGNPLPTDITAMCYSGGGDPFILAANTWINLDIKSVVLVGAPIRESREIKNSNIETIINIMGENDRGRKFNDWLRRNIETDGWKLFPDTSRPLNQIAIELKGVRHTDYFYDPYSSCDDPDINELRQKATRFIAEVTHRANEIASLRDFLDRNPGVNKDDTGKYIVDLDKVEF